MKSSSKFVLVLLLSACLPPLVGCADFDLRRPIPWVDDGKNDPKAPGDVVVFWQNAIHHRTGRRPTRGFGGRIMFHDQKKGDPTKVEGTLVVYAFDEENRRPGDNCPTRKFVFPAEQFAKHYSESELGHSYSVWIPWDEVGGPTAKISLIARFMPLGGAEVVSGQAKLVLPGRNFPPAELADQGPSRDDHAGSGVRPASYDEQSPDGATQDSREQLGRMISTTIQIPPRFGSSAPTARTRTRPAANPSTTYQPDPGQSHGAASSRPMADHSAARDKRTPRTPSTTSRTSMETLRAGAALAGLREFPQEASRSVHSPLARSRSPASPTAGLSRDRAPSQPSRSTWRSPRNQSALPSVTVSEAN